MFLSIIGALQLFDLVWVMTGGGPSTPRTRWRSYMFKPGFQRNQFGYGSAARRDPVPVSLVVALLYQRFVLRRDTEGALTAYGG